MTQQERDRLAYTLAKEYLLQFGADGVTSELIEKYLCLSSTKARPESTAGILLRLLESAQNANMKANVIGGAIGGIRNLTLVLFDFDPVLVIEEYPTWEPLFERIQTVLKPKGQMKNAPHSLWVLYCRTILSAAQFMTQFSTADDFYAWADFFDRDDRARPALPLLLDQEIFGLGFALACDFLKELGYVNFAKPDIHLKDIFRGLGLCLPNASDFEVFKSILRVAQNVNQTPYNVDKLFWLVGSGYFYEDVSVGYNGKVDTDKWAFIQGAKDRLN